MDDAADQIVGLYRRHAQAWAAERGHHLAERNWLDRFAALLPPHATILDIGCGSGTPIARYLLAQDRAVTGIDSSPELLALARSDFPTAEWIVADMRTLALNRRFNGLIAWDSFFHLRPEDQRRMMPRFRQHAAPRAALMFTSGTSLGTAMGTYQGEALYHASLDATEYRTLLDTNGFDVITHVIEDPTCGHRTIWLAQLR